MSEVLLQKIIADSLSWQGVISVNWNLADKLLCYSNYDTSPHEISVVLFRELASLQKRCRSSSCYKHKINGTGGILMHWEKNTLWMSLARTDKSRVYWFLCFNKWYFLLHCHSSTPPFLIAGFQANSFHREMFSTPLNVLFRTFAISFANL